MEQRRSSTTSSTSETSTHTYMTLGANQSPLPSPRSTPTNTPSPDSSRPPSVSIVHRNIYYEAFTTPDLPGVVTQKITGSRHLVTSTLIKQLPYYLQNEPLEVQRRHLARHFNCICSDCDGPDVEGECLVEKAYHKKYESVRHNTIL